MCPLVGGVYGLSNSTLDVPWSKVKEGKTRFSEILDTNVEKEELVTQLQELLSDKTWYVAMVTTVTMVTIVAMVTYLLLLVITLIHKLTVPIILNTG